jgi:hypothetical protein
MLWVYPASLRREYGREMLVTFRNEAEDAVALHAWIGAPALLFFTAADWLRTIALEPDEPVSWSLLGLGSEEHVAAGRLEGSTFSISLLLATLGIALLIAGWYEWLTFKSVLTHHPAANL